MAHELAQPGEAALPVRYSWLHLKAHVRDDDAGVSLRDTQNAARRADQRTTLRYSRPPESRPSPRLHPRGPPGLRDVTPMHDRTESSVFIRCFAPPRLPSQSVFGGGGVDFA